MENFNYRRQERERYIEAPFARHPDLSVISIQAFFFYLSPYLLFLLEYFKANSDIMSYHPQIIQYIFLISKGSKNKQHNQDFIITPLRITRNWLMSSDPVHIHFLLFFKKYSWRLTSCKSSTRDSHIPFA